MKILHINSYYAYYGEPGFYKNFFDYQIKFGLDISVYVPLDYIIENAHKKFGGYTNVLKTHNSIDRYIYHIKQNKMLKRAIRQYKIVEYDLIHAHSLFSNGYVAYMLNKMYDIPYVVAIRDTDINVFFKKMFHLRKLGIKIMENASNIIFLSETYRDVTFEKYVPSKYYKDLISKIKVIPNGIDPFWLNNKIQKKIKPDNDRLINILYVGHISKRKNPSTTLDACHILKERGYKPKFTIVGEVKDYNEFNKLKNHDLVVYIEPQRKESLLNFYRDNDIFVMPSVTETFGLVYAEAMSQGMPVIYSKGQGFDRQFTEGLVGYHVNSYSAEEIADRIIDINNNYSRLAKNCIKYCTKFDWEQISNDYSILYQEIIRNKKNL